MDKLMEGSGGVVLVLMWLLNAGISTFNAWSVGRAWPIAKLEGGWFKLLLWSGATMAACGFTWCLMVPAALVCHHQHWLPERYCVGILELGYIVIIGPVLTSGLIITCQSIVEAIKRPGLLSVGSAAYNTWAMVENTMGAIQTVPAILKDLGGLFSGGDSDGDSDDWFKKIMLMIAIVVGCLVGGIVITTLIVRATARKYTVMFSAELEQARKEKEAQAETKTDW